MIIRMKLTTKTTIKDIEAIDILHDSYQDQDETDNENDY